MTLRRTQAKYFQLAHQELGKLAIYLKKRIDWASIASMASPGTAHFLERRSRIANKIYGSAARICEALGLGTVQARENTRSRDDRKSWRPALD